GELTAGGLILVPYFYDALGEYQEQESSMNVYYRSMILGIDPRAEAKRLQSVRFTPLSQTSANHPAPGISEEDRKLDEGDNLIYQARYAEAKAVFGTVLEKIDPHSARALYGLAIVASNLRKPDTAEDYFKRTLGLARDLRIVTWSHIYLGRLYDL